MTGREFLRGVLLLAHRLRPDLPFGPDKGQGVPLEVLRGRPRFDLAVRREGEPGAGAPVPPALRRRQGFLADDVGITMYLGTRGGRGR